MIPEIDDTTESNLLHAKMRPVLAATTVLIYMALDLASLYKMTNSAHVETALITALYTTGAGLFLFYAVRSQRAKVLSVAVVATLALGITGLAAWPVINSTLIRIQHGEPQPYDDANTIYVN